MKFRPFLRFQTGCAAYLLGLRHARQVRRRRRSMQGKLLGLPGDAEVYPGHFSGSSWGVGMSGRPSSTIAFERGWPMPALDREAFVAVLVDVPPKPGDLAAILAFNGGRA
jgi:hypothetical protein